MRPLLLFTLSAALLAAQKKIPSTDGKLYAVEEDGQKVGKGEEFERFSIFTADDKPVSVVHIWLTEPDGTGRVGIRGCESSGWIDSTRFYCEGTFNPSMVIYRWFDAMNGKELGERIGSEFTWSPDRTTLANYGNVPHFTDVEFKSDSLEVGTHAWPSESHPDGEQHWFRSSLTWSPDSRLVAVVDHQRRNHKAFFLEIVDAKTGKRTEHKLLWPDEVDEWFPDHDFRIEWSATLVTLRHDGKTQAFSR